MVRYLLSRIHWKHSWAFDTCLSRWMCGSFPNLWHSLVMTVTVCYWVFPSQMVIFHSYVNVYQRVPAIGMPRIWIQRSSRQDGEISGLGTGKFIDWLWHDSKRRTMLNAPTVGFGCRGPGVSLSLVLCSWRLRIYWETAGWWASAAGWSRNSHQAFSIDPNL